MIKRIRFEAEYQLAKRVERAQMFVAWRCPRWLVRWTVVRAFAQATSGDNGDKHPDEVTYGDVYDAIKTL